MIWHLGNKSKSKDFLVIKREHRLICVAILIGAAGIGAYLYLQPEDSPINGPGTTVKTEEASKSSVTPPETPAADTPKTTETQKPAAGNTQVPAPAQEYVDPVVAAQKQLIQEFKDTIKLDLDLPPDLNFSRLDLEGEVAVMEGVSPEGDRKMVVMAAAQTPSPETIAAYINEQKIGIPSLSDHNFKISGEIKSLPGPKGSGISTIKIIPAGSSKGTEVYAAQLIRSDKQGSYVFIMRASPNYFENYEGDLDNMLANLSAR